MEENIDFDEICDKIDSCQKLKDSPVVKDDDKAMKECQVINKNDDQVVKDGDCLKDMTELSREEKQQHLHSYHRDETVVRQKHGVSEDNIHMKNAQQWNPSLQTKDDLSENCMDPGSLRGDGHSLKDEEGVGEKPSISDVGIDNSTNEHFGENKILDTLKKPQRFPCGLCRQTLKTDKALQRHRYKIHIKEKRKIGKVKRFICEDKDCRKKFTVRRLMRKHMLLEHGLEVSELNKDKYVCGECGRNCMNRYNLEHHIAANN